MSEAETIIRGRTPAHRPKIAIVLGSGLSSVVESIDDPAAIPYRELPGFPVTTVSGHPGQLVLGRIGDVGVAVMVGRAHYYESGQVDAMRPALEALAAIGCETLVLTNAAGSLDPDIPPGCQMLISDHISFSAVNPLFGDPFDDRFVDMVDAYDPSLRAHFREIAKQQQNDLREGVFMWFPGPSFETPAEIRAARVLGADAVGMSVVPEVIVARRLGLRVAAVSNITNLAAGMTGEPLTHEQTLEVAGRSVGKLTELITGFVKEYADV